MRAVPLILAALAVAAAAPTTPAAAPPPAIAPFFAPPPSLAGKLGAYRSPLLFDDGTPVRTPADWTKRRAEILAYWRTALGPLPPPVADPKLEILATERADGLTRHAVRLETAPGRIVDDAYLLVPDGPGPFPAVVVVFYEAKTPVGLGKAEHRDFARLLAKRGFVALALGGDPYTYYPTKETCRVQPIAFHAYEASTGWAALAKLPTVDPKRIGVTGHSYGSKWAMFAAALDDGFAAAAFSDGGIVFDETRPSVNYWEPWYLGFDPALKQQRAPRGIITPTNPRTGPYKQMVADGRDLHELLALMAPRPFLVSGGSEDSPERWAALNHVVAVNDLLGAKNRVAMTNRPGHSPTPESNEQLGAFFEFALK